jgi:hypothetical protein
MRRVGAVAPGAPWYLGVAYSTPRDRSVLAECRVGAVADGVTAPGGSHELWAGALQVLPSAAPMARLRRLWRAEADDSWGAARS